MVKFIAIRELYRVGEYRKGVASIETGAEPLADLYEFVKHHPIAFLAGWFAIAILLLFRRQIYRATFQQPCLKKICTTATALKSSTEALQKDLVQYQSDLKALTNAGITSSDFSTRLDDFKLASARLGLPKIDPSRYVSALDALYPNFAPRLYCDAHRRALILAGYCNTFREVFSEINSMRLDDLEDYRIDSYHSGAAMKPDIQYAAHSRTRSNADRAIRYFKSYDQIIEACLNEADLLKLNLEVIVKYNRYGEIRAAIFSSLGF